mgnify:CR=1 FL=1
MANRNIGVSHAVMNLVILLVLLSLHVSAVLVAVQPIPDELEQRHRIPLESSITREAHAKSSTHSRNVCRWTERDILHSSVPYFSLWAFRFELLSIKRNNG